jgi:hypothetical protein
VITGSLTLSGCSAVDDDGHGTYRPSLDINQTFAVLAVSEADENEQYAIQYEKLRTWMKDTQVTVTYNPNKTLGGVNAVVNDQVGPTALAAALAAVKIAGGLSVPAVPSERFSLASTLLSKRLFKKQSAAAKVFCTTPVLQALRQIDADNNSIYEQSVKDADAKAAIPSPKIARWNAEIAELQRDVGLVRSFTLYWSPTSADSVPSQGQVAIFQRDLDLYASLIKTQWLNDEGRAWYDDAGNSSVPGYAAVHDPIVVQLSVLRWTMGSAARDPRTGKIMPVPTDGLVLRDPAVGTLRLCRGACSSETNPQAATDLAAPAAVNISQLGRYIVLPLKNQVFENSNLVVALNADGTIASLSNHSTGTLATNLATAGQIGDQLATNAAARNSAIKDADAAAAANAAAVDTANKTLADCLTQQAAVKAAGGTPVGNCQ